MKLLLISDAWEPQVNGVVRTLRTVLSELQRDGHTIEVVHPGRFKTFPCPTYPEIRLAPFAGRALARIADEFRPDAVHIATEGPLGLAGRRHCLKRGWPFTTSYHTRFPEYIEQRFPFVRAGLIYRGMRWFHGRAARVMVATESIENDLNRRRITNTGRWSRGVDIELFRPREPVALGLEGPIFTYVGRVAVEKNIEAFLELDLPGSKLVVGDGPARAGLAKRYPEAHFAGAKHGEELARHYCAGDVFVFPSRTDTFGLVMLEALACGLPVAAFPVPGPLDVVGGTNVGVLDEDLAQAAQQALALSKSDCRAFAERHSWKACADLFFRLLEPFGATAAEHPPRAAVEPS